MSVRKTRRHWSGGWGGSRQRREALLKTNATLGINIAMNIRHHEPF